jgi:hypothetical protein
MATIPKLALIPSGYKAGKIYSVLPTTGVGDFDFTRASSATRVNSSGLIETVATGIPRLNYPLIDGVVNGCPSQLLEPASTNLITYSEDFINSAWTKVGLSVTSGFLSPNGSLDSYKLIESATSGEHYLEKTVSENTNNIYTQSIFVKPFTNNYGFIISVIGIGSSNTVSSAKFNILNGLITTSTIDGLILSSKVTLLTNGQYKCSLTYTLNGTVTSHRMRIRTGTSLSYAGDGTSGIYIFGAQLEQQSYPTSYIPTSGSAVTRVAETASGSGDANTFNDSEGVLMVETSTLVNGADVRISLSDGGTTNKVEIEWDALANTIKAFMSTDGSVTTSNYNQTLSLKIAVLYKLNNFKMYINGFLIDIDTTASDVSGLNQLNFAKSSGANDFYGNTKQIQYFDSALNDSELETLTSWTSFTEMANGQTYSIK